jgi:radical SAM superfamily enzyme YgiQ (UPF0313 family)
LNNDQPHVVFFYNDYESLGLEYLSAVLKSNGVQTSLKYSNLLDFYAFDSVGGGGDDSYRKIALDICDRDPDVLGLSLVTDTFHANMEIARYVKKQNPRVRVLAGGVHATLLPELTLGYPQVDAVCIGEGEYPTLEYVLHLNSIAEGSSPLIHGIVYKQNGKLVGELGTYYLNRNLDDLPLPDKDLFYCEDPSMRSHYFVQCSRGCPFCCSFCINDYLSRMVGGRRFRYRKPDEVIRELSVAKEKYSPSFVVFVDECFGVNKRWVQSFLSMYAEKIGLPFLVSIHPDVVTEDLADLLKTANCWYVAMGVQSLSERISSELLKRPIKRDTIARSIQVIRSRGIFIQCDHIFGIQGETREDLVDALSFYNENRPSLVSVYWLSYYPKALITEDATEKGILSQSDIMDIEHGNLASGIKRVRRHHDINFWINYFVFFPKWMIRWILSSGIYRLFRIKNPFVTSAIPRAIHAVCNRRDWNRYYLKRVVAKKLRRRRT